MYYRGQKKKGRVRRKSAFPPPLASSLPNSTPSPPPASDTLEYVNECSIFQEHYVYRCRRLLPAHPLRVHAGRDSGRGRGQGMGQTDIALSLTTPGHPRYFALRLSYPLSRPFRRPRRGRSSHSGGQPEPR